eukprot:scaffold664_cov260-Pinguiococcus_pyrenoidosus.AAC.10
MKAIAKRGRDILCQGVEQRALGGGPKQAKQGTAGRSPLPGGSRERRLGGRRRWRRATMRSSALPFSAVMRPPRPWRALAASITAALLRDAANVLGRLSSTFSANRRRSLGLKLSQRMKGLERRTERKRCDSANGGKGRWECFVTRSAKQAQVVE